MILLPMHSFIKTLCLISPTSSSILILCSRAICLSISPVLQILFYPFFLLPRICSLFISWSILIYFARSSLSLSFLTLSCSALQRASWNLTSLPRHSSEQYSSKLQSLQATILIELPSAKYSHFLRHIEHSL